MLFPDFDFVRTASAVVPENSIRPDWRGEADSRSALHQQPKAGAPQELFDRQRGPWQSAPSSAKERLAPPLGGGKNPKNPKRLGGSYEIPSTPRSCCAQAYRGRGKDLRWD